MLTITLPSTDDVDELELHLEHSLVSLSSWEAIHEKPFFSREEKTEEETKSYVLQMVLDPNPPGNFLDRLRREDYEAINLYINSKQTATFFHEDNSRKSSEIVTSELIYYWMISFQIPFSCETWHLNRLMTLIRICGIKNSKPKRMSRQAQAEQYRALNERRRAELGTSG